MLTRIVGVAVLAASVLIPIAFLLRQAGRRVGVAPSKAKATGALANPSLANGVRNALIPDPFLRPETGVATTPARESALRSLLAAQVLETKREETVAERTRVLAFREVQWQAANLQLGTLRVQKTSTLAEESDHDVLIATESLHKAEVTRDLARTEVAKASNLVQDARKERASVAASVVATRAPAEHGDSSAGRGALVERDAILLLFRPEVMEQEIAGFLEKHRLAIRSSIRRISFYTVEMSAPDGESSWEEDATRLRAMVDRIKEEDGNLIQVASQNVLLGATVIPHPNPGTPRDWFASPADPLVTSHFPAAWNFATAMARRSAHVNVGVLDIGFLPSHEDLDVIPSSPCGSPVAEHGTAVAGVIGAKFDNGKGIDGAAGKFVTMYGCAPDEPVFDLTNLTQKEINEKHMQLLVGAFIDKLESLLSQTPKLKVINASVGYNWKSLMLNPDSSAPVKQIVEGHGTIVRRLLLGSDATLVAAAGNDSTPSDARSAAWASPFNWAALGASSVSSPASENVIVVEALKQNGVDRLAVSNVGGMIRAVGENVLTTTGDHGNGPYGYLPGTSAATPLVSAAVALMLAVNPTLTAAEIKTNLGISPASDPTLNAYEAVRLSAADAAADLADFDGDGKVDNADFEAFRLDFKAFIQLAGGTFPRDLNGDGLRGKNDRAFCRSDLDDDGDVDTDDLKILIAGWPNADAADLKKRLLQ